MGQTRAQAQEWAIGDTADQLGLAPHAGITPGPAVATRVAGRVAVSGWQSYDNKGRVIEAYEPFFSHGWEFQREADAKRGQHTTTFYDPRGNIVRTLAPDGSQQRIILGRPTRPTSLTLDAADLVAAGTPAGFEPTPWETYSYDANDLAPLCTAPDGSSLGTSVPTSHHFTPDSSLVDALGRVICKVERNGPDPTTDWYLTCTTYDVRGNPLTITDAHHRDAFGYVYDLLDRPLRNSSRDAGLRTWVLDALGNPLEARDSKGSLVWRTYDRLNRPKEVWARDTDRDSITLRERIHYGDEEPTPDARARRTLGRQVRHYDEAGLLETPEYDFTGNLTEKSRRTVRDDLLPAWTADWSEQSADTALESRSYVTNTRYDALGRPVELTYPQDADAGPRKVSGARYNHAGALESLTVAGTEYVRHISYDARGRRDLVVYGNGLMTRQAYDPLTLRLVRLRTEPVATPPPECPLADLPSSTTSVSFSPAGDAVQDFTYAYDLAGNIVTIDEQVVGCGIMHSPEGRDHLLRRFAYDPIYRLVEATGRACAESTIPRGLDDDPRCGFYPGGTTSASQANAPDLTQRYTERFRYDPAGNMLELHHSQAGGTITWKRSFGLGGLSADQWEQAPSNRLTSLTSEGNTHTYEFDDNGNLVRQNTERHHTWDHADRMTAFRVQPTSTAPASVEARYLYAADGMRVKKWTRNQQQQVHSITYIDGVFEQHRRTDGTSTRENTTLHIMDGAGRIAQIRAGAPLDARDATPPVQYSLGDHLGSSHVVVGGSDATSSTFINREEFFAHGETSFGSFGRKRYRYSGKERDEESGLYYYGTRYLASWLQRWVTCDPTGASDGLNPYTFVHNNPITFIDLLGLATSDPKNRPISTLRCHQVEATAATPAPEGAAGSNAAASSSTPGFPALPTEARPTDARDSPNNPKRIQNESSNNPGHEIDYTNENLLQFGRDFLSDALLLGAGGVLLGTGLVKSVEAIVTEGGAGWFQGELTDLLKEETNRLLLEYEGQVPHGFTDLSIKAMHFRGEGAVFSQGNVAVLEYMEGDEMRYLVRFSEEHLHSERVLGKELESLGIDPQFVTRVYSERQPCDYQRCATYLADSMPNAKVTWSYEHGSTPQSKATGNRQLRKVVRTLLPHVFRLRNRQKMSGVK